LKRYFLKIAFLFALSFSSFLSQDFKKITVDTFIVIDSNYFKLRSILLLPGEEKVFVNGNLIDSSQYRILFDRGSFYFENSAKLKLFDTVVIFYHTLFEDVKKDFFLNKFSLLDIGESQSKRYEISSSEKISIENIFGDKIKKSGYIYRGFSLGSNKALSVNSGLNLQLSGKISDEVEIAAVLSEERLPLQPEGTSQNLQEIDNIYIYTKGRNFNSTIGDFAFNYSKGEFSKLSKKSRGASINLNINNYSFGANYSSSKGKYNSISFNGLDGIQGPYRLLGAYGEKDIIVLAGSEKVYLNGKLLTRGEENDYIIDYALAEIRFTSRNIINSFSRIYIEFQYADLKFQRSFAAGFIGGNFFNEKFKFDLIIADESDLKNSSIGFDLSADDKKILKEAGGDRSKAFKSGVKIVQDSLQIGLYKKIDTIIDGNRFSYYRFAPGDDSSKYIIEFSYVGSEKGDYKKISLGVFEFVGIGKGDYAPIIFLPLPQSLSFADVKASFSFSKYFAVDVEAAGSVFDKNLFSDSENALQDLAYKASFYSDFFEVSIQDFSLGKLKYSLNQRKIGKNFYAFERFNSIEFDRDFNIKNFSSSNQEEILREARVSYSPINGSELNYSFYYLRRGENLTSLRNNFNFLIKENDYILSQADLNLVDATNRIFKSKFHQYNFYLSYIKHSIKPSINFESEKKIDKKNNADSLEAQSFYFHRIEPSILFELSENINARAYYSLREDYRPAKSSFIKESATETYGVANEINYFYLTSSANLNWNNKRTISREINSQNKSIAARLNSRINLYENGLLAFFYYETFTQKTAEYQRIFLQTEKGTGQYRYLGDLNNNGIKDEFEFERTDFQGDYTIYYLPTDNYKPSIELKANLRTNYRFDKILSRNFFLYSALKYFSGETQFQIYENSTEPDLWKIYLLQFKSFLNRTNTIRGNIAFLQDVKLFEGYGDFNARLRYANRKGLNKFVDNSEKFSFKELSSFAFWKIASDLSIENETALIYDKLSSEKIINRSKDLKIIKTGFEFAYFPFKRLSTALRVETQNGKDFFPEDNTDLFLIAQILKITFIASLKSRIYFELERNEVETKQKRNYLPYELTLGNNIGINWRFRGTAEIGFWENANLSLNYEGRKYARSKFINLFRAEARAFF